MEKWEANMPKIAVKEAEKIIETVGSREHSYDVLLGRLGMTTEALESFSNKNGIESFRKLNLIQLTQERSKNIFKN